MDYVKEISSIMHKIDLLRDEAIKTVKGKKALIISDFYDQPFGSSRPNLKGKIVTINDVDTYCDIHFSTEETMCPLRPDQIRFID